MENEAYLINGGKIKLAWRIQFNLTGISDKAKMEHIFPYISSGAIVSLQNLCNCGFMAGEGGGVLNLKKQNVVIQGNRNQGTPLWEISLNLITLDKNKNKLKQGKYLRATAYF